jgi:hypothetical protein
MKGLVARTASRFTGLALAGMVATAGAAAQPDSPGSETALLLGPSPYGFLNSGTGFAINLGLSTPLLHRVLFLEPNLGYFTYTTQFGHRNSWFFPELSLQAQAGAGKVRPYFGGGMGGGSESLGSPTKWDLTLHALAGIRMRLVGRWGLRGEFKVRSVHPWRGHTNDFGIGVTHASF